MSGTLSDLLTPNGGDGNLPADLQQLWQTTEAARELKPLPAGTYEAVLESTAMTSSRRGTPAVRLVFRIEAGEHAGRRLRYDAWLTPRAMGFAKRDLAKLGIASLDQIGRPLPGTIVCKLRVALRRDDGGQEFNRINNFDVTRVDPLTLPERDPFAPEAGTGEATTGPAPEGLPF